MPRCECRNLLICQLPRLHNWNTLANLALISGALRHSSGESVMAQNDRNSSERGGRPMRAGPDRDPFRAGDERRYVPDRGDRERGFRGDRSYATGGYSEEQGYRHEDRADLDRDSRSQRDEGYWRNSQQERGSQFGTDRAERNPAERNPDQWSQQTRDYGPERQSS